jgi:hypothetical protein
VGGKTEREKRRINKLEYLKSKKKGGHTRK